MKVGSKKLAKVKTTTAHGDGRFFCLIYLIYCPRCHLAAVIASLP